MARHALAQAARRVARGPAGALWAGAGVAGDLRGAGRSGTSYAVGWRRAEPRLRDFHRARPRPSEPKAVWLYPLREEPRREMGAFPALELQDEASWAERGFSRSDLPDGRLRRLLLEMGGAWETGLGRTLPEIFPGRAQQAAACHVLHNPRVTHEHILQPQREAPVERSGLERTCCWCRTRDC